MNVEIITPAGRERYVSILYHYVLKLNKEKKISCWNIWVNTTNQNDIAYLKKLETENTFIKLHYLTIPHNGSFSIYSFFKTCLDENTIYVRFDDDIVFVDTESFDDFINFRINNPNYFLVYANIINNAVCSHIHQRNGIIDKTQGICGYSCMDNIGWKKPEFSELVHKSFINNIKSLDIYKFHQWELYNFERVSINCFAFFGKDFKLFNGDVGKDEEKWLSEDKPRQLNRPNTIFGGFIVSHYAFYVQRDYLDKTDLLSFYQTLSEQINVKKYLVVGSGFSGSVIAEQLSNLQNCSVTVIDERNHIGGNCYTEVDKETGITTHKYGPHIFNTNNKEVWDYVNTFDEFYPYKHQVKACYKNKVFSLPINLHTINQFFNKNLSPAEAKILIDGIGDKTITNPQNFEEQGKYLIGEELYKTFFYGYTKKQWGCEPKELPASILKRLPIRFNYDDSYYYSKYVGIPKNGYTHIFKKMLDKPNICLKLNTKFDITDKENEEYDHIFYTGTIDSFFDYKYGKLGYRTVYFEKFIEDGDYQGVAQMNYTDEEVPYTRICEHKHFVSPFETFDKTVFFKEYSKETEENDVPYYPKRLETDIKLLEKYQKDVKEMSKYTFLGRLATYRYMDMHQVIEEALDISKKFVI